MWTRSTFLNTLKFADQLSVFALTGVLMQRFQVQTKTISRIHWKWAKIAKISRVKLSKVPFFSTRLSWISWTFVEFAWQNSQFPNRFHFQIKHFSKASWYLGRYHLIHPKKVRFLDYSIPICQLLKLIFFENQRICRTKDPVCSKHFGLPQNFVLHNKLNTLIYILNFERLWIICLVSWQEASLLKICDFPFHNFRHLPKLRLW